MIPSPYQQAIYDFVTNGRGDGVVNAVAGSGKTTTLIQSSRLLHTDRAVFIAYNKHIQTEISARLQGSPMTARTAHSIGAGCLYAELGKTRLEEDKYKKLAGQWVDDNVRNHPDKGTLRNTLAKVADMTRLQLVDPNDYDHLIDLADYHDLDFAEQALDGVDPVLSEGEHLARHAGIIDFTDMLWLVYRWNLTPKQQDWVFVDECLPYLTPVQLADGTSMSIGDIVEQKAEVKVLAYDPATHTQKPCRVIGWSKTLNQKPLVKVKVLYRRQFESGKKSATNFVVCTTDHKIWADNQWVQASDLQIGMIAQVETSAIKSQAYKITSSGCRNLSAEMTRKNNAGLTGGNAGVITERGGNGRGLTLPQQTLLEALGDDWIAEYTVATGMRSQGYPTAYKIDLANPSRMIAVEIDGGSHHSARKKLLDNKKDTFLRGKGWRVIRFSNRRAVQETNDCVHEINVCEGQDCPIDAIVVSVEPVSIPDYYVYDITVEDCHNFYANGILTHNCQDLSALTLEIVLKCRAAGGRMLFVGDPRQAIYAFAGADAFSFANIIRRTKAIELPLSVCYRCPSSHLELARIIVPGIEDRPDATRGEVLHIRNEDIAAQVHEGDLIVARKNVPLVSLCIRLISQRIPARMKGRDIGAGLVKVLREIAGIVGFKYSELPRYANEYEDIMRAKFAGQKRADSKIQALEDRCESLVACFEGFTDCKSADTLEMAIDKMFTDTQASVWLSTVHKAKGLEAENVFILNPEDMPLKWKNQLDWEREQEMNLKYVALTRGKQKLTIVDGK